MSLFAGLTAHGGVQLSTVQILSFLRLSSLLKHDIMLAQPVSEDSQLAPLVLPPIIVSFLAESIEIPEDSVETYWDLLKEEVWALPTPSACTDEDERCFHVYGWKRGLTSLTLYPPHEYCKNLSCSRTKPLKKEQSRQVVVFTLANGVRPAWSIHLYCPECRSNYHNNFWVNAGQRTYYGDIPDYIQVGEHQFVEKILLSMWTTMMLVGWFSATNCARSYDMSLAKLSEPAMLQGGWKFGAKLKTEHVWDGFVILALLEQHERENLCLVVPHTGDQKNRFDEAMKEHNEHIIQYGHEEAAHNCQKCMRTFPQPDGTLRKCQVVVTDGLTLGHPCCGIFRCTRPLQSNRHRFCDLHFDNHNVCAITGCDNPVVEGSKVCSVPAHQEMQRLHVERGKAAFTLRDRLQRQRVAHPNDAIADEASKEDEENDVEENVEWFEIDQDMPELVHVYGARNQGSVGEADGDGDGWDDEGGGDRGDEDECEAKKSEEGNQKFKARFGRQRTHNEQTLVWPCGVIQAHATMVGAEAVSNVLLFVKKASTVPGVHPPDHLVYDTNCDAKQQVLKSGDPFFKNMGMCVDVWHFLNKHKVTHEFCQEHCNPADYPELLNPDGSWYFNTSVAEQTNAWLGGYHAICREMLPTKYNFFLDEMIRLRNIVVIERLREAGENPQHAPPLL